MTPVLILLSAVTAPSAALRLPAIFSDHMVFQRRGKAQIWGWAAPRQTVTVRAGWSREPVSAKADAGGKWSVTLSTGQAGGPFEVVVKGGSAIVLRDVMIGDVWVCSGQSNMEFTLSQTDHAQEDIDSATKPKVRLFHLQKRMSDTPLDDCQGSWATCTPKSVAGFSAVGYFFGREVSEKLNVPIGLIDTTWGGTEAELWISEKSLLKLPEFAERIRNRSKSESEYRGAYAKWLDTAHAKDAGWGRWWTPGLQDSGWQGMSPLKPWSQSSELKDFDGIAWFRGAVNLDSPDLITGSKLELGSVDDDDETWFNGEKIGATNGWNVRRVYPIPDRLLKRGRNEVTVRVTDTMGEGGWNAELPRIVKPGLAPIPVTDWRFKKGVAMSELPPAPAFNAPRNSLLYNGMIHPIVPFAVRGAIWYQGESNVGRAFQYRALFPAMILDWRQAWKSELPFLFVQIAPFDGYGSAAAAELREAQLLTLKLPQTGMAVTTDVTENIKDIHPRDKRNVGHRLALWALARTYGQKGFDYSGPLFQSAKPDGERIRVRFTHARGLTARGGPLKEFEIAGVDHRFFPARAEVSGNEVVVWSTEVKKPVAVRFGWSAAPLPNLFNASGLPASPFRSDDWPGMTDKSKW